MGCDSDSSSSKKKKEKGCKEVRAAQKRIKRITKSRDRLMELVDSEGEFPTLAEIEAALAKAKAEVENLRSREVSCGTEVPIAKPQTLVSRRELDALDVDEAAIGVCFGKPCLRQGAEALFEELTADPNPSTSRVVKAKCLGQCKAPGVTILSKTAGETSSLIVSVQDSSDCLDAATRKATADALGN